MKRSDLAIIKDHSIIKDEPKEEKTSCHKCEKKIMKKDKSHHVTVCTQRWLHTKGNMNNELRDVVGKALKICHKANKLNPGDITITLQQYGMSAMVFSGHLPFSYCDGSDTITWSRWKFDNVGGPYGSLFSIFCILYRSPIDHISCMQEGSMTAEHREIVLEGLKYCSKNNIMTPADIRTKLKEQGLKTVVIKNDNGFAYASGKNILFFWLE